MRSNKNVRSAGVETPHSGNQNQLANQANANTITVMMEMFTGIAFILLIALSMTMFGCGGESQSKQVRTVSETTESTPSPSQSPIALTRQRSPPLNGAMARSTRKSGTNCDTNVLFPTALAG